MTPVFKFLPGAPIGSGGGPVARGQQWMSWIHLDDIVGLFQLAVENDAAAGPINGTSPNPVRNAEFSRTLSSVLRKPYTPWRVFVPMGPPDVMIRLMLGEVASVVTSGQKVQPRKALALGYHFRFPGLADALRDVFTPKPQQPGSLAKPVHAGAGAHH
jgi:NAD dependent epimerase/dehydratase family enzyme